MKENSVHYDELGIVDEKNIKFSSDLNLTVDDLDSASKTWLKNYMTN